MEKKLISKLKDNLGIQSIENESELESLIEERRVKYLQTEDSEERALMYGELNASDAIRQFNTQNLLNYLPSLARTAYNLEVFAEGVAVATMNHFRSVFIDFDSQATNSISTIVSNGIRSAKKDELAIYREGTLEHVYNYTMQWIEEQGNEGRPRSKSAFVRSLKTDIRKKDVFSRLLREYIEFKWTAEMMKEGTYTNTVVDAYKQGQSEVKLRLNKEFLPSGQ